MKKTLAGLMAIITLISVLVACGGGSDKDFAMDGAAVAKALLDGIKFDDTLAEVPPAAATAVYGVDAGVTVVSYMGSGATAEQIAVFEAADKAAADALTEKMEAYIARQIESYKGYVPTEVPRLEKAIIKAKGKYVILCVTADTDTANSIISDAFAK